MIQNAYVKFQVNIQNSDVYLNQDSKSKRGDNAVKNAKENYYYGKQVMIKTGKLTKYFQFSILLIKTVAFTCPFRKVLSKTGKLTKYQLWD